MCLMAMMFSNLSEIGLIYLRLEDRVEQCVAYSLVQLAAAVGLNILLIAYLRLGVTGFVVSKLITSSLGCAYLMFRSTRSVGFAWNGAAARRMFTFGGPLVLSSAAFFVIHFGDRWFLSSLRGMEETGSYALAYRFAFVLTLVVGEPFGKVWNVNLYNYISQPQWKAQFARVARYLTFTLCLAGLALSMFADDVVHHMAAPSYHGATPLIPMLVAAYVCREVGDFFRNVLYINKRSALVGRIALAAAILNTVMNALTIARWGMYGAALSTLLTWALYMAACWFAARREHAIPFTARGFAMAGIAGLLTYAVGKALPPLPFVLHAAVEAVLLVQFIAVLWLLSYFPAQERQYIKSKLVTARVGFELWVRQRLSPKMGQP
jgi:O-antigen/teichoic acid export membrane protein